MSASLIARFTELPDLHQNPRYGKAMEDIGWTAHGLPGSYLYVRKLGPIGVAKIQRPKNIDLPLLKQLRKSHHLLTTYVEPGLHQAELAAKKRSALSGGLPVEPFANSATSLVDLTPPSQEILAGFKQKTRYNIGLASRKHKLTIVTKLFEDLTQEDFATFKSSRDAWSKRKGVIGYEENFIQALLKHFGSAGWLHFAFQGDVCVGSLMILKNGQAAIYYAAFADTLGYSLFAPTLLTWTAMTIAKAAGCTIFDFGGIYDPRYKKMYKKWQGFTKFKEGFSPTVVTYPPTTLLLGW